LKILEVSSSGTIGVPPMGPVSNVVMQLALEFQRLGQDTTVADVRAISRQLPMPCIEIDAPLSLADTHSFAFEEQYVDQLFLHDIARFDIVHVHEWKIAHVLHRRGIRTAYTAHTPLWISFKGLRLIRDRLRGFIEGHERQVIRDSLVTIALGNYMSVRGSNVVVIPSGIRAEEWTADRVNDTVSRSQQHSFSIICVARFAPEKGLHVFVEALRRLTIPYSACIVGSRVGRFEAERGRSTRYAEQVLRAAKGLPIYFTGFIPNTSPEFRRYVGKADVSVVPSLFEPQGTVVLEALAMGIPVVGSRVGGIPLMLTDEVGCLVAPGDAAALAGALADLYHDPERLATMAARARPHVLRSFSWDTCARLYIEAFERVRPPRAAKPLPAVVPPSSNFAKRHA
jgi:glycosyltransferase involved in cell wall biosynthesis